jgi:hypothetical protein
LKNIGHSGQIFASVSPTVQRKGKWPDFFGNQKMLVRPKEG